MIEAIYDHPFATTIWLLIVCFTVCCVASEFFGRK